MSIFMSALRRTHPPSVPQPWLRRAALWGVAAVAAGLLLSSCGGSSGGDGGTPPTTTVPTDGTLKQPASYVAVTVLDADTGQVITSDTTVTLSGPDVAQAVTPLGAAVTQLKTSTGFASFSLKATAAPSASKPVVIQLGVVTAGYLSGGAVLSIAQSGATDAHVRLVRTSFDATGTLTNAPAGVTGKQATAAASADGGLASNSADGSFTLAVAASSVTVPVTNSSGAVEYVAPPAASISIPAGVKAGHLVTNAQGVSTFVPAAPGPVVARVIAFSPQSASALSSFPGGFAVMPSAGGGITEPSVFQTAGFAAFEFVDSAGNAVDHFSGPVTMIAESPASTRTPQGALLVVGDKIPVWSYNASSAEWKSEGDGTVIGKAANGNWMVSFLSTHLSYWNLDYAGRTCNPTINILGRAGDRRPLDYGFSAGNGQYWSNVKLADTNDLLSLWLAPADMRVTIVAYDRSQGDGVEVGRISNVSLCEGSPINLNVALPVLPAPRVITVSVREACPDGSNERGVAAFIGVIQENTASSYLYSNDAGIATKTMYQTNAVTFYTYDARNATYVSKTAPAAAVGASQSLSFDLTMSCNQQPKPTGGTGGTGGTTGGSGSV